MAPEPRPLPLLNKHKIPIAAPHGRRLLHPMSQVRALALLLLGASGACAAEISVKDLGIPVKAVNWVRLHPGRGPDGKASLLASMGQNNGGLFVLDVDLATGKCRQSAAPGKSQQYPTAAFRSPQTGVLYIGAHTDGHLLRYDPAHPEAGLEDLGAIDGEHATFPTGICEATDGGIWIGAYPDCTLTRFDPAMRGFTRYGSMDDTDKYLYPLCGSDGTIAALTKVVHPHLIVFDPQTRRSKTVGPVTTPDDKSQRLRFYKALDGLLYLDTHAGKFRLSGGELAPVDYLPPVMPGIQATYQHADQEALPMPEGLVASWEDGDEGGGIFRRVRLTSTNPAVARRTLELDWKGGGTNLFLIHPGADGLLYGSSFLPEHVFRCAPDGSAMINLGRCSESLGEAYTMGNFADGTMAIASYPQSRISLYDPRRPFRYGTDSDANPQDIGRLDEVGIRPVGMAVVPALKKSDGSTVRERLWTASLPDYGTWGGTLAWLDPKTRASGSHRHLLQDCAPFSLLWLPDLKQLLVGLSIEGGTGTKPKAAHAGYVLWDPAEDRAVYRGDFGRPLSGDVVALAPAGDGRAYALVTYTRSTAGLLGPKAADGPRLALVDPAAWKVVMETPLPESAGRLPEQVQHTIFPGPGGTYGVTERVLYKIKPGTCDIEIVWRAPEGEQIDTPGPWIGRTFYFATGWKLRAVTVP
ncbi:MAG: hypothetical protein JWM88_1658 [Verrucomicrobia bacterium]|nr:hypothetical protein [Verrucomicrobiota bacterium]